MDEIQARAIEVLENERKAMHWLRTPNRALQGAVPMTLLDTPAGKEEVLTILGRIEYGVYS
jgi:putative toxin-antitoxin system antitoxin component (TIGR02293 family)